MLICGEPGTGRTSTALELAGRQPVVFLNSTAALLDGETAWARRFDTHVELKTGTLCVEGIDLLPDRLLKLVIDAIQLRERSDLVLTSAPIKDLTGLARTLAGMCVDRIELAPLSDRTAEICVLALRAVHRNRPDATVRLTPSVVDALSAQSWPGNLHELTMVMAHALRQRTVGDITVSDLPEAYRVKTPEKRLGRLERAEREAIVRALAQYNGNKKRTAQVLGLSRTTLYSRIRALKISG